MASTTREIIYEGNSIISVESLPDYPDQVVIKKPSKHHPSQQTTLYLEKEYEMSRSLNTVEGVRKAYEQRMVDKQPVLILEYVDGTTLRDHIVGETFNLRSKLEIANDLALILAGIHQQNIIHLDLNSENVLIGNEQQSVHIIDLGSAAHIDRTGHLKIRPDQVLGTLPYISPEQTGRINRAIDERSDLYSLGIVLYELMTGQLPFDSSEPMELVHQHIARAPVSPTDFVPEIPEIISAIILKLLSKNAEDRYQSAAGVRTDLEKCLKRLSPEDTIEDFPVGETDYTSWLRFPQKLYGRDNEVKELEVAFESVCRESSSIVFVAGYSGIGKTALVEELQRPVSEKNGYFIQGKFDQLATTPYSAISQALTRFISRILTQTETQLASWRSQILEALGPNGRVLTDVVPSLELVIGPQPAVPDLSGKEAQNRFNYVFQRFFNAIARSEHPLCFFLDDLQWIDSASLDLLKNLFSSPDLTYLLVVGAYRDNEVDEDHPLMTFIADLDEADVKLRRVTLRKISEADIEALISDSLRRGTGEIRELSRMVYSRTDGNPFFTRQLLRSMEDKDLIALDTATGHWRWDMEVLRDLEVMDSVVELLVGKLKEFSTDVQETLKVAACIGNQFDIATLTVVTAGDDKATLDHVQAAVVAGLIWARDDRGFFVHDRVQEATYALVPLEERDRLHLTIGRHLLLRYHASDHEQDLFRIVDQLNHGLHLVEDEQEQIQIARLNLEAGRKAKNTSAFFASAEYLKRSASLLAEDAWREQYPMMLDVYNEWVEACYLSGQFPEVEVRFNKILEHGKQVADFRIAYRIMILTKIGTNELYEAISIADEYLERLQISFDAALESRLSIDEFYNLPVMKDKEKLAAMEILEAIITPIGYVASERVHSLICTMLNIISRYGNCEVSSIVVAYYATFLCTQGRYQEGNEYGLLSVKLLNKFPSQDKTTRIMNMQNAWIQPWVGSVHDSIAPLKEFGHSGLSQGVFEYGSYSLGNRIILMWIAGSPLPDFLIEAEECIRLCRRTKQEVTRLITALFTQAAQNLTENAAQATKLEGRWFSEESMLQSLEGNVFVLTFYRLLKMTLSYLFEDSKEAYGHIDELLKSRNTLFSHNVLSKISFYGALACTARLSNADNDVESRGMLEKLELFEEELRLWAQSAPMNFLHQYDLVMAEKSRVSDKYWKATQLYEKAIRGAQVNQFVHDQALANELFGQFWTEQGNKQIAELYLREARDLYDQWGASAKVSHIEERYPERFQTKNLISRRSYSMSHSGELQTNITQSVSPMQLDLESIISASQMLSAETDLEMLLRQMIALVMANSGADKAILLLKQEDGWFVQAWSDVTDDKQDILLNQPFDPADSEFETGSVPEAVFNYCHRSKEVMVVGDAQLDSRFSEESMIQSNGAKSMACVPVLSQGRLRAMLYLENRQMTDVFTTERVEILKHLTAQFGVSVENAVLYDSLNDMVRELQINDERYQLAVAGSTAGLWDWEILSDTVHYSDRFNELLGYAPEELSDSLDEFWSRIHPDDYRSTQQAVNQHLEERVPFHADYRLQTKSKEFRWFHARGNAIWDEAGRAIRMSGSMTDITERKQVEEELRQSEERFRSLMERSPLAIEILNPDGHISQVNAAWLSLYGVNEEETKEVLAQYNMLSDSQIVDQGIMPLVERAFSGNHVILPPFRYDAGRTVEELGLEHIKAKAVWIQCHLYAVKDASDEITHVVNIYMDITELKGAEQETQEQREALARVDRTTSMGQLTGSISHELNQPLTGILSNAQAAEMMIASGHWEEEEISEIMADIADDAKRAGDVIRNLRQLFRKQRVEFLPIDINAIVEETTKLLHSEFIIKRVMITTQFDSSLPWVNGNRIQIQQVLLNLIMNASQAMSDTAGAERRVHIITAYDAGEVEVCVADSGSGIDPNVIDGIFEPLATWKPGHTGMGLAISNSIINAHGGRMWAENRLEGGARVGFAVPIINEGLQE